MDDCALVLFFIFSTDVDDCALVFIFSTDVDDCALVLVLFSPQMWMTVR